MRKTSLLIAMCLLLAHFVSAQNKQFRALKKVEGTYYVEGRGKDYRANPSVVTVKFKSGVSRSKITLDTVSSNKLGFINIAVPKDVDLMDYLDSLQNTGDFEVVEYNVFGEFCAPYVPNDPQVSSQWHLEAMNVYEAWTITKGSPSIKVAVIDAGPDWTHSEVYYGNDNYKNVDETLAWDFNGKTDVLPQFDHGTRILGIIGAKTNNAAGIAGIAGGDGTSSGVTLIPINIGISNSDANFSELGNAIVYAVDNGARVISLSLKISDPNDSICMSAIDAAIEYAVQNNVLIVCASGNAGGGVMGGSMYSPVTYPASHPDVIAVGAIEPNYYRWLSGGYGQELDVVAPGVGIWSITVNNGYNSGTGTSFSSPMVSGVAALMLSANPNLSAREVRNIIESTTQKIMSEIYSYQIKQSRENGSHSISMGYGLIDAYAAVYMAKYGVKPPPTVLIRDNEEDCGIEPNPTEGAIWDSPDIWVRHLPDGIEEHQNPDPSKTNFIHVRINNPSAIPSRANEMLTLYWAKADTSLEWPSHWNGNGLFPQGALQGDTITSTPVNIGVIPAGEANLVVIPWDIFTNIPDLSDYYSFTNNPHHFYLLARIESMTFPETKDLYSNVKYNNRIAWKHITIRNCSLPDPIIPEPTNPNEPAIPTAPPESEFDIICSDRSDLVIRDMEGDASAEPNPAPNKAVIWNSPDIWVRQTNDGGYGQGNEGEHQNPAKGASEAYVYVRIKNMGTQVSSGEELVHLYWTKASTSSIWQDHWNGENTFFLNGPLIGNKITSYPIPILLPGEECIVEIYWELPSYDYNSVCPEHESWYYGLLARIEGEGDKHEGLDSITYLETADLYKNVKQNNNIAWKNLSIMEYHDEYNRVSAVVNVWNIYDQDHSFNLYFKSSFTESESLNFWDEVGAIVKMDDVLYDIWERGGKQGVDIDEVGNKSIRVLKEGASLQNLIFQSGEIALLELWFTTPHQMFNYTSVSQTSHIVQTDAVTDQIISGHAFQITELSLSHRSSSIISIEKDIDTSKNNAFQMIQDSTNIETKLNKIVSIYPNPATHNITVTYKLNEAENAYISVSNYYFATLYDNYILDINSQNKILNLNNYTTGLYVITLVCDGVVSDVKTFIKH